MQTKVKYGICKCGCTKEKTALYAKGYRKHCYWKRRQEVNQAKAVAKGEVKNNKPKKRINPFSDNKLEEMATYRPLRNEYMYKHGFCEFKGCHRLSNDLHHKKPRKTHLCDVTVFMAVCRSCHDWIHSHHNQSVTMGYLFDKFRPELYG